MDVNEPRTIEAEARTLEEAEADSTKFWTPGLSIEDENRARGLTSLHLHSLILLYVW